MRAVLHLSSQSKVEACKVMLEHDGFTVLSNQNNMIVVHGTSEVFSKVFSYRVGMYEIPDKYANFMLMINIA